MNQLNEIRYVVERYEWEEVDSYIRASSYILGIFISKDSAKDFIKMDSKYFGELSFKWQNDSYCGFKEDNRRQKEVIYSIRSVPYHYV